MALVTAEQIASKMDSLPPMPQAVLKLSQLLEQEEVNAEDLAQIIRLDPDLTSQLLRLCNSAAYGIPRTITTVKEAVAILGFKVLKSLVYAIMANRMMNRPVAGYNLGKGALWLNGVAGAVYARRLAEIHGYRDPETAFTAAILRDIGKIALESYVGESYREIEEQARLLRVSFSQAEHDLLGFSHTEVGHQLAAKWQLPPRLDAVITYHHTPGEAPADLDEDSRQLLAIVHLADSFAMMLGAGIGGDGLMYAIDPLALEWLDVSLTQEYVETTLAQLIESQHQVQALYDSLAG